MNQATTKIKKEVDELKKIVFLIIASLLVLGLVLPGCEDGVTPRTRPVVAGEITIGVAGPMSDIQGKHHWAGAEMALDALNSTISVGGVPHTLKLLQIDTNEVHGAPGDGYSAMLADIGKVDFVIGGFRTEAVTSYREVAMREKVLFFNCGAATEMLQKSVVLDYDRYKYWFKATPYNETFLVTSLLRMTGSAAVGLRKGLVAADALVNTDYKLTGAGTHEDPHVLRVAIIAEMLSWAHGMVAIAMQKLPDLLLDSQNITIDVVGPWRPTATATDLTGEFTKIEALHPHIVFTVFSGPVGVTYSKDRLDKLPRPMTLGINVEGQSKNQWTETGGDCVYDMMLDTWAVGMNITPLTHDFFTDFVTTYEDYPTYCAATYDAIHALAAAIETTGVGLDPAKIIAWLENPANALTGVGAKSTAYYPEPGITIDEETGEYALSEAQAIAIYPHLEVLRDTYDAWTYNQTEWLVGPHTRHDTVYGSEYQTGIGVIWEPGGTKVGWWPLWVSDPYTPEGGLAGLLGTLEYLAKVDPGIPAVAKGTADALWDSGLLDNYGYWSWQYPGTMDIAGYFPAIIGRFCAP